MGCGIQLCTGFTFYPFRQILKCIFGVNVLIIESEMLKSVVAGFGIPVNLKGDKYSLYDELR